MLGLSRLRLMIKSPSSSSTPGRASGPGLWCPAIVPLWCPPGLLAGSEPSGSQPRRSIWSSGRRSSSLTWWRTWRGSVGVSFSTSSPRTSTSCSRPADGSADPSCHLSLVPSTLSRHQYTFLKKSDKQSWDHDDFKASALELQRFPFVRKGPIRPMVFKVTGRTSSEWPPKWPTSSFPGRSF